MKLIYISNVRMPTEKAHGVQMIKMCEAFSGEGAEVEFIVPFRFNDIKQDVFDYYGVQRNFKIKKVFSIDLIRLVPWFGYWVQYISFVFFVTLRFLFHSRKNNLIYTREFFIAAIFELLGFKTIYEAHRVILKKSIFFYLVKNIDKIITNSAGTAEAFKDRGFERVLACPNGVDLKNFNFNDSKGKLRQKAQLPKDKKIAMYTGYLYRWKGIDVIFDAAKNLKEFQEILLVLVGGSEEDIKRYREKTKKEGLNNILFLGHKNKKDIPYYLKSADVLLLPNIPISEESIKYTSPVKLPEYMASGTPIIASNLPSIKRILNDDNAVLIEPNNSRLLSESIKSLIRDKTLSNEISSQARRDAENYTWEKRARKIIKFIQ